MACQFEFESSSQAEADLHRHYNGCLKNPGHVKFIPIPGFCRDDLLPGYKDDTLVDCIRALGDLTVRIRCSVTSANRPDTLPGSNKPYPFIEYRGEDRHPRFATGWILYVERKPLVLNEACGCESCQRSSTPLLWCAEIEIRTAAHHVYDKQEAESTTCDLFFDEGSSPGCSSKQLVSCRLAQIEHDFEGDYSDLTFTTHDKELAERLEAMVNRYQSLHAEVKSKFSGKQDQSLAEEGLPKMVVIVSHPHGCSKQVTVGEYVKVEPMENRESLTRYIYTTATCRGSSGAPVFVLDRSWLYMLVEHPHSGQWDDQLNYSGFALV